MPSARGFGKQLDSQISGDIDASGKKAGSKWGDALKAGAMAGAAALGVLVAKTLGDSISAASQAEQAVGGVQSVFGKYADSVLEDSKKAAQGLGLSAAAYNELITVSGAMLKNKGLEDFAEQSKNLLVVGADLAAQFGGSTKEAVDALNAAMRGESDPIERYGISLNETAVNAVLAANGQTKLTGAALEQAKAQARLSLITQQSADAQGAFARESDTLAGQQQRLGAEWDNLKVTLGAALLPALTEGAGAVRILVKNFGTVGPVLATVVAGIVAFKVASLASAASSAVMAAGMTGATGATWSLNAALRANPIGIVVTALTVLAAGLVFAYKKSDTFRSVVDKAFSAVKTAGSALGAAIGVAFSGIKIAIEAVGKAGTWLWNNALQPAFKLIVQGVAFLLDMWAKMLGALGKVPGFGWAKDASEAMGDAAEKARDVADGIKKIDTNKAVTITVTTIYKERNAAKEGSMNPELGFSGRGALPSRSERDSLMEEYGRGAMDALGKGFAKGGQKTREQLTKQLDKLKGNLSTLRDSFASLAESVSSAFTGDLFTVPEGSTFIDSLLTKKAELTSLLASFKTLQGWGLSPSFLSQLFASGNGALITELAGMGQAGATSAANLFGEVTSLGTQLGGAVATNELGPNIDNVRAEIGKLRDDMKDAPKKTGKATADALKDIRLVIEGGNPGQRAYLRTGK
ncbi:hypothetical protein [Arthrobacter sp. Alg241-R88]|uniref:hypothetical protein n=1 Tax=Arthrobacter sp. Alg241-R88 TaxID=2305984 RepID=UPI0013D26FC3|nr:hypothetical protein [Arthrobacter sp. Alg241-R88]